MVSQWVKEEKQIFTIPYNRRSVEHISA